MNSSQLPRWRLTECCDPGHREFRKLAAAGSAGGAGSSPSGEPGTGQARTFPPPPPAVSPIEGLMDTHFHSGPDVFARALDDEQGAQLYKDRGMGALVLKNHVVPTADRAWFVRKHMAGINVFGGIALNNSVGGLNPIAVDIAGRLGAKVVWLPTVDSARPQKGK